MELNALSTRIDCLSGDARGFLFRLPEMILVSRQEHSDTKESCRAYPYPGAENWLVALPVGQ